MNKQSEPATISLFYSVYVKALIPLMKLAIERNVSTLRMHREGIYESNINIFKMFYHVGSFISVLVIGFATIGVLTLSQFLIVLPFTVLHPVVCLVIRCVRRIVLWTGGERLTCPSCYQRSGRPIYSCPSCRRKHLRLFPNRYGIFSHRCVCGTKLSTLSFLRRRGGIGHHCPHCLLKVSSELVGAKPTFIPLLGPTNSGKTSVLAAAVSLWSKRVEGQPHQVLSLLDSNGETSCKRVTELVESGVAPGKTIHQNPTAFVFRLKKRFSSTRLLYFYDPAGAAFTDFDALKQHSYYPYADGFLFVVDAAELSMSASSIPFDELLDRFLFSLENEYRYDKRERLKKRLAVVFTKLDSSVLQEEIGDGAVVRWQQKQEERLPMWKARSLLIREQLLRVGKVGFVTQVEGRFREVRYYACSAYGKNGDSPSGPFLGRGVTEPVEWVSGWERLLV